MKKFVAIVSLIAVAAGCVGVQKKLADAKAVAKAELPVLECRAKVIEPVLDYVLSTDVKALLEGADITDYLVMAGLAKAEVDEAVAAFEACKDAK
jgi:hypothetical protein